MERTMKRSSSRVVASGALAVFTLLAAACATMRVHSYLEPGADLSRYRTYAFGPAGTMSTGDPRLDDNPFFNRRVQADVDRILAEKGYQKAKSGAGDLLIHYHASVSQQIELADDERSECRAPVTVGTRTETPLNCLPYSYDQGTLLIDLVNSRTKQLVWRGWAESSMDDVLRNQEWMEQQIDDSVRRILAKLPGRSKQT